MHPPAVPVHITPLQAPSHWRELAFISDLHLCATQARTAALWMDFMARTQADALFILGDWFELWLGDDDDDPFIARCAEVVRDCIRRGVAVYVLHGNRDFLMGDSFAQTCGITLLPEPVALTFEGNRYLLCHGDALCTSDDAYMRFRQEVRTPAWRKDFLSKPLSERRQIARALRAQSEAQKQTVGDYAAIDEALALQWLRMSECQCLIHGHTHQAHTHTMRSPEEATSYPRVVLSDWDAQAHPQRAQVLYLRQGPGLGLTREDL